MSWEPRENAASFEPASDSERRPAHITPLFRSQLATA